MSQTQLPPYQDDLFEPETRDELRRRLRQRTDYAVRRDLESIVPARNPAGYSQPDSSRISDLISPMSRDEANTLGKTIESQAEEPPVSIREMLQAFSVNSQRIARELVQSFDQSRFATALRANPKYRYALAIALVVLFVLLLSLVLIGGSKGEGLAEKTQPAGSDDKMTPMPVAEADRTVAVVIMSAPSDAKLTVDGQRHKQPTPARIQLAPGPHALLLEKPGYEPWMESIYVKKDKQEQIFSGFRLRKRAHKTQVTIAVDQPQGVTIQLGDSVHPSTNRLTMPLAPGLYRLRVQKDGYEVFDKKIQILEIAEQQLPAIRLKAYPRERESASSRMETDVVPIVEPRREVAARPALVSKYGFRLNRHEGESLSSAIDKVLNDVWNTSSEDVVGNAARKVDAWNEFAKDDPRLYHAQGLALWRHGRINAARNVLAAAVLRERSRPGQKVPYYPIYRDRIRLEVALAEEEVAVEELADLIADTKGMLAEHPDAGFSEAKKNADFAGRMMGYLEGPARHRLSGSVNPRLRSSEILEALPDYQLKETYKSARAEVQDQYQEELELAADQIKTRAERERALQETGELGTTQILSLDKRVNGRLDRSDHGAGNFAISPRPYAGGFVTNGRGLFRLGYGWAGFYYPNVLFNAGPAISRSFFHNHVNDTRRFTRKKVVEKLPKIARRRPEALTTYMPEELERKRRDILKSVSLEPRS